MTDATQARFELQFAKEAGIALAAGLAVFVVAIGIDAWLGFDRVFVKYNLAAQQFLDGTLPPVRRMDLSPFYFELAVVMERLFTRDVLAIDAMAWLHRSGLAAASALAYLAFSRRLPRAYALLGVVVFAFSPQVLVYARVYEPEMFVALFLLGFIVASDRETACGSFVAGLFAACAIATRPTFLPLFPLLAPGLMLLRGDRARVLLVGMSAFLVPIAICGVLLGLRAEAITGDAATPVMNPGTVFYEGNHPLSRGTSAAYPVSVASLIVMDPEAPDDAHNRYRTVAREELRRSLTIAEVNAFWSGKAIAFIVDEPLRALRNGSGKVLRILSDDRWHDTGVADALDTALPIPRGWFGLLVALAVVGAVSQARYWRRDLAFYAFAMAQVAVMAIFYVSARQQMVLVPSLVFFALSAVREGVVRGFRAWPAGLVVGVLAMLSLWRDDVALDRVHGFDRGLESAAVTQELGSREDSGLYAAQTLRVARTVALSSWLAREIVPGNVSQEPDSVIAASARLLRSREGRDLLDEFDLATLELAAGEL